MTDNLFRDIPFLLGEIRSRITPEACYESSGMPSGKKTTPPAPLSVSAVDDSDKLYASLITHMESTAEAVQLHTPRLLHARGSRGPVGFTAHTTVDVAITLGRQACRFIEYHLPFLTNDLADEIYSDLQRQFEWLASRYQRNAESEQLPARCPECMCLSVYKKPPKQFGGDEVFHCRTCMKVLTEAEAYKQCEAREKELKKRKAKA